MGVAFAEVSPDICFCVNTRRHRGVVSVAAGGVRHCNAGGLYAGGVMRVIVGADAFSVAGISPKYSSTAG